MPTTPHLHTHYIHMLTIREPTPTSKLKRGIPDISVQSRTFVSGIDIYIPEITRLYKHKQQRKDGSECVCCVVAIVWNKICMWNMFT